MKIGGIPISRLFAQIAVAALFWVASALVVGAKAQRYSLEEIESWKAPYKITRPEESGQLYQRYLAIRKWKRYLPEAGDMLDYGFNKRRLMSFDQGALHRYELETKRAEYTHWWLLGIGVVPLLWVQGFLAWVVPLYALFANLPCLVVQRYNRARLQRVEVMATKKGLRLS